MPGRVRPTEGTATHVSRWRPPARHHSRQWWFARYVVGYFWLLCAAPIMLLYMGSGAAIIGFVTVWFGFNYHSFGGILKSVLHDETLVGLGMGLHLMSGTLNQAALARGQARWAAASWLICAAPVLPG